MMTKDKKTIRFVLTALCAASLCAPTLAAGEVPNTLGAVKTAKPGDYIVLRDGSHYVLVASEIEAVNGTLDYDDEALKQNEVPRSDGGIEYNITSAHKRIVWEDGKSMDILTTTRAYDAFIKYLSERYDVIPFTNYGEFVGNSFPAIVPDGLLTFRGKVYSTTLTNGVDTYDYIDAKEYNRTRGDGVERCYQMKGGDLCVTLSGGGNLSESGTTRDE